jgi:hypothetical protein
MGGGKKNDTTTYGACLNKACAERAYHVSGYCQHCRKAQKLAADKKKKEAAARAAADRW